ncbi:MAG: hypothetical protein WD690_06265 [Vicinamibacterales bacterium]
MMRPIYAVALVAVISIAVCLGIVATWGAFRPPDPNPEIVPAAIGSPAWKVTKRYSVNRVLIVEGESTDRERAMEIARFLVGPSEEAYDEVLVYVRAQGDPTRTRRVQWTKKDGYRILDF